VINVFQIFVLLSRLNGDPIGLSVLGIFVIDKNAILMVKPTVKVQFSFWFISGLSVNPIITD